MPLGGGARKRKKRSFTQIPDWMLLNERINSTALRLWCILRSMQFENGAPIPAVTIDELCWLLPGVNGKPSSRPRVTEALETLISEGLLEEVEKKGTARIYKCTDESVKSARWWSAKVKLRWYAAAWRKGT